MDIAGTISSRKSPILPGNTKLPNHHPVLPNRHLPYYVCTRLDIILGMQIVQGKLKKIVEVILLCAKRTIRHT